MPSFPTFAYSYSVNDYSYTVTPEVAHTVFYGGTTRQRSLIDGQEEIHSASIYLTNSEMSAFESFVSTDLENGTLAFDGPYYDGLLKTGSIRIIDGNYSVENVQNKIWKASFSFEVIDRDLTDAQDLYGTVVALGSFSKTENIASILARVVNGWPMEP